MTESAAAPPSGLRVLLVGTGVFSIPPTGYGGVERTLDELARALTSAGASVEVLNEVRRGRTIDEYYFALHLKRLLRGRAYDALHASTPVVANRLAMLGLPYVYTTHSRHWFLREGWRQSWGYFLERRAVLRARAAIALTKTLRDQMVRALAPRGPTEFPVVPIGVDLERFRADASARNGRRVLGVGVIRPFKRWEVAAQALRGSGLELTIVGPISDPGYAAGLRAIGPHVRLAGELSEGELTREFARSDLLVHPSSVELLAGVVLQGLAAGLPVVGAPPVADLIDEGVTGFVVPDGDGTAAMSDRLAAVVTGILADPAMHRRMSEAARASAERRFSWPAVARAHLELYARARSAA
ncbi:MAG TPA: glycosyltransferase family 4 protein [Thermoplasmata archaeon]|nr:glycosyltransferase family 4 protein [Thermoplasmata archaeon]